MQPKERYTHYIALTNSFIDYFILGKVVYLTWVIVELTPMGYKTVEIDFEYGLN